MPVPVEKKARKKTASDVPVQTRLVSATEFKAKCLGILDDIEETGRSLIITRRGKPVATIGPAQRKPWKSLSGVLAGRGRIVGDIIDTYGLWEYDPREKFKDDL